MPVNRQGTVRTNVQLLGPSVKIGSRRVKLKRKKHEHGDIIIALGGVRENAKNLYIVEINDSIFILDAGLKYPENEQLGVDFVIPNLDYLIENRDRIKGFS